jgi:hypothetical protein
MAAHLTGHGWLLLAGHIRIALLPAHRSDQARQPLARFGVKRPNQTTPRVRGGHHTLLVVSAMMAANFNSMLPDPCCAPSAGVHHPIQALYPLVAYNKYVLLCMDQTHAAAKYSN